MTFFTADWHYGHEAIISYCDRPFKNVHYMNKTLVDNYRSTVTPDDECFFLGDLTLFSSTKKEELKNVFSKLHGHKHLILGNHDCLKPFDYHELGFESVHTILDYCDYSLVHDPVYAQGYDQIWLCGHVHNLWTTLETNHHTRIINVGVDVWGYKPVALDQLSLIARSMRKNENPL